MRQANETVRRQDRLMDDAAALHLLRTAEYGVLSLQAPEGGGYGIPLHFAWDGSESLVFHSALEGRKLDSLAACDRVSFCIVGGAQTFPRQFGTDYESLVLQGTAACVRDEGERKQALLALAVKYLPEDPEAGRKYVEALFHRTMAIRMTIDAWTAKKCALRRSSSRQ